MKKIVIYSLSVLLVAGAAISCRKTSKGKVSNEWQLDSYSQSETERNDNGDVTTTTIEADESTITTTTVNTPNGDPTTTTTQQGTVNDFAYVINKDGTWELTMDVTFTSNDNGVSSSSNEKTVSEGTWNFLGNVEEFKRNERVVFNTTSVQTTTLSSFTVGGQTTTTTTNSTESYANGEMSDIRLVVESKRKELQLKTESDYSYTETQSGSTDTYTVVGSTEWSLIGE
jgi:hypothetical protein